MDVDGEWKKAGRDSSTAQADSFAGAKEEEKRRLAPLGMTVMCFGEMTKGRSEALVAALLPAAGRPAGDGRAE